MLVTSGTGEQVRVMAEYIEREALLEDISESVVHSVRGGYPSPEMRGANKVIDRIKAAPTADVVEVVRCKDCAIPHNKFLGCPYLNGLIPPENHFCGYGERKEGAEG